jgi:NADH:ubiquinone oxidoreductase subunit 3 (subunit A)
MNEGTIFLAMICVGIIVVVAIVTIVMLLEKDRQNKPKGMQKTSDMRSASKSGWNRWLPYFGIALLLAFWSFWISLLFLVTVWLLSQNPDINASHEISDNEKKTAKRVYNWLFWSPVITVPVFLIAYDMAYQINELVFAALLPLIFHAPLLLGLTSKSAFVYRHTQQGILLIALRAGMAALFASLPDDFLPVLFLLGNGSLWLFGTLIARNQVIRGECWLMKRKGEMLTISTSKITPQPANIHLEKSRAFIEQLKKNEAYEHALAAFRTGDRAIKQQAVQLLETLDEVEQF